MLCGCFRGHRWATVHPTFHPTATPFGPFLVVDTPAVLYGDALSRLYVTYTLG
ncbi:MAG: hypothetical protein QOC93_3830 [Actinomycetota bacterium]|nr:hypothetical protein [Actinomycetota bacterium]